MTAINFPDTPTDNEEFTSGGRTWKWDEASGVWESTSTLIPIVVTSPGATSVPLTINGAEGQTANIFNVSNSSNSPLFSVLANGTASIPAGGISLKSAEGQTDNILNISNSSDSLLFSVLANGRVRISAGGVLESPLVQNAQTGTSYSLVLLDAGKLVELSDTSTVTVTVPLESSVAFPIGTQVQILQTNTGQVVVAEESGVTVNATPGARLRTQWSSATLIKRATNTWVLIGDLVP